MSEQTITIEEAMKRIVDQYGPRTGAVENFIKDLDQAFLITTLLKDAGQDALKEVLDETNTLAQKLGAVDATEVAKMSEEDREKINSKATDQDNQQIEKLHKKAMDLNLLATDTTPNVLFLFLITKFEAYIEDILTL